MGITGLIPFLEKSSRPLNLQEIRGTTVAVDTYCLLHKGAYACADKLVRGEDTNIHIQYCLKYVKMLLKYRIKPIMVFDGRHLPAKAITEQRRRESRKQARSLAGKLLREGKIEEARSQLRRCVDITHSMALEVMRECRKINVDAIVAPYEADAQLAFFNLSGIADYIITEDSDLLLFGCSRILFKLDLAGNALFIDASKLHVSMGCRLEKYTFDRFRNMCILSGCDYLDSLPGIGLAKACKFFLMTEETDLRRALPRVPAYLKLKNLTVAPEYIEQFLQAVATFKFMWVFDPSTRRMVRLMEPDASSLSLLENAGEEIDPNAALQLALGNLDPFSLNPVDNWNPDVDITVQGSIWRGRFAAPSPKRKPRSVEVLKARNHCLQEIKTPPDLLSIYLENTQPTTNSLPSSSSESSTSEACSSSSARNPFRKSLDKSTESLEVDISPSYVSNVMKASSSESDSGLEASQGPRKLSKFCRTVLNNQYNVVSRFWNQPNDEMRSSNEKTPEKSPTPEHLRQIYGQDEITGAIQQNLLTMFEDNDENCQKESPEAVQEVKSPPRKMAKKETARGTTCRVPGLKKPTAGSKLVQSTLSKFGFIRK
ncbi:exonuclease 1 [Phlebotomus argentipes]|uniref:exonuclease 1 n=1 Tax=Phlebotomus argentipes TaxID=94469 RepID=UPI0028930CD6|nr:exonuclease 1 [Phlebotomus argentipes]